MARYECRFNIPVGEDGKSKIPDGMIFGKLKVIHRTIVIPNSGNYKFKCECLNCGEFVEKSLVNIVNNKNGCKQCHFKSKVGKGSSSFKGYEEISSTYWTHVKQNAKIRNIIFDISIEYGWEIFIKQNRKCNLSKVDIVFRTDWKSYDATASLDRISSDKGYIEGNVQWLHKDVNTMKWNLEQKYFIEMCRKITENAN